MVDRRMENSGSMTHEIETPYGVATLYVSGEASRVDVRVQGASGLVLKTRYTRSRYTATEWKPETNAVGSARKATGWGMVPKKDRHNTQIVVDALVLAWLKNHEAEMQALRVASMRSRAWRMLDSANTYADIARKLATDAEALAVKEVA